VTIDHTGDNWRRVLVSTIDTIFGFGEKFETGSRDLDSARFATLHLLVLS